MRVADRAAKIAMPFIGDLVTPIRATSSGRQPKDVEFAKQMRRAGEESAGASVASDERLVKSRTAIKSASFPRSLHLRTVYRAP